MKTLLFLTFVGIIASQALATDTYDYKPGEYIQIDHGLSPDKKHSLAAGLSGDTFHVFLMDAAKKKIGPLTEIQDLLDNGPNSFHAAWSPDSRHVAVTFRADRHLLVMVVYRIEDRRAVVVNMPVLFDTVAPNFDHEAYQMTDSSRGITSLEWKSATRFELSETSQYYHLHRNPKSKLGKFAKVQKDEGSDDKSALEVFFSAVATCELNDHDEVKIIDLKPGKFYDEN